MQYTAHHGSNFAAKVGETGVIGALDVDGCLATREPSATELTVRKEIRRLVEKRSALALVSARTPELMMSQRCFDLSKRYVGRVKSHDLLTSVKYLHLTDPPAIASLGCGVYLRNGDHYLADEEYRNSLGGKAWYPRTLALAKRLLGTEVVEAALAPHESVGKFETGEANVLPLDFRIELLFKGKEGLALCGELRQGLQKVRSGLFKDEPELAELAYNIEVSDESSPSRELYRRYLTPTLAPKECMLNQLVNGASEVNHLRRQDISIIVIDDSLTGLKAGCLGGHHEAGVVHFIPCGSELGRHIHNREDAFADVSIEWLHRSFVRIDKGRYSFTPGMEYSKRTIVFGDEAYSGLTAPESVLACVEEYMP